jgi:hypothetical protein
MAKHKRLYSRQVPNSFARNWSKKAKTSRLMHEAGRRIY